MDGYSISNLSPGWPRYSSPQQLKETLETWGLYYKTDSTGNICVISLRWSKRKKLTTGWTVVRFVKSILCCLWLCKKTKKPKKTPKHYEAKCNKEVKGKYTFLCNPGPYLQHALRSFTYPDMVGAICSPLGKVYIH